MRMTRLSNDRTVLALVKGSERYLFTYDDASQTELLRLFGRFATNPELNFTWADAAVLGQRVREGVKQ